jgi:hypothetical protein
MVFRAATLIAFVGILFDQLYMLLCQRSAVQGGMEYVLLPAPALDPQLFVFGRRPSMSPFVLNACLVPTQAPGFHGSNVILSAWREAALSYFAELVTTRAK